MARRTVAFARINRRSEDESFERRPFPEDMAILIDAHNTRHLDSRGREWIAGDMTLDPSGDFMTGVLGFQEEDERTEFDPEAWSWVKGEESIATGASKRAVVPFAVDVREDRRWVAHVTAARIRPTTFAKGLALALNAAINELGLWPTEWEVDLITSRREVEEWISQHREIRVFRRTVKRSNPGHDITEDIDEMRALGAGTKKEEFVAGYDKNLRIRDEAGRLTDEMVAKLRGLERGDLQVFFEARAADRAVKFWSRDHVETGMIDDFGDDLERGMSLVLDALRSYSEERARGEGA